MKAVALAMAVAAAGPTSAQFMPSFGYPGGAPHPGVAPDPEPGSPKLTRLPDAALQPRFRIDPSYSGAAHAHVKVVGAYAVAEAAGAELTDAWAPGFLPVTLVFGDGRCFTLTSTYEGGMLSNGRLARIPCEPKRSYGERPPPASPAGSTPLGHPWGFGVWLDRRAAATIIGAPLAKSYRPLVVARMTAVAVMAMNSPDAPLANLALVGRIDGRLTVVTLELVY